MYKPLIEAIKHKIFKNYSGSRKMIVLNYNMDQAQARHRSKENSRCSPNLWFFFDLCTL